MRLLILAIAAALTVPTLLIAQDNSATSVPAKVDLWQPNQTRIAMLENRGEVGTRLIDIESTVKKVGELFELTPEQAKQEVISTLGLFPLVRNPIRQDGPTYKTIDDYKLQVTATIDYLKNLPNMISYLESGKKQVSVRCLIVSLDPKQSKRINAFFKDGTATINCAALTDAKPVATLNDSSLKDSEAREYVSTSTTVSTNTPVITGKLDSVGVENLLNYLNKTKAQKNNPTEILMAPKVMMYPGQVATVSDAVEKPFVVGLEDFSDEFANVTQPIVQTVPDGVTLRVKALPRDESLLLLGDIVLSEVEGVETVTFAGAGEDSQKTIQIPRQRLRQVHIATKLQPNEAVLIDPNFLQKSETKKLIGSQTRVRKTVFLLQADFIQGERASE